MKLLLDTHVLLWSAMDEGRLSTIARSALSDPGNELYISSVSGIELATKIAIRKLRISGTLDEFLNAAQTRFTIREAPFTLAHAREMVRLPLHHRDPFDRALIAQAIADNLTLVSADHEFVNYGVPLIW
jgi:PIN domain nuclease of toxin-antitoxin system